MSDSENPEFDALNDLEAVVRHVSDELGAWRRRALNAEGDRPASGKGHDAPTHREENAELRRRLEATRARMQDLLKRLRFLEEQASVHEVR